MLANDGELTLVKISLDGPAERHDRARGAGSFDHALRGARAAQAAGVPVEFTCTLGRHNVDCVAELLDIAESLNVPVVFQPALKRMAHLTAAAPKASSRVSVSAAGSDGAPP